MSRLDPSDDASEEKETIKIATIAALAKALKENTKQGHFRSNGMQERIGEWINFHISNYNLLFESLTKFDNNTHSSQGTKLQI